jgi:hypothetical protein
MTQVERETQTCEIEACRAEFQNEWQRAIQGEIAVGNSIVNMALVLEKELRKRPEQEKELGFEIDPRQLADRMKTTSVEIRPEIAEMGKQIISRYFGRGMWKNLFMLCQPNPGNGEYGLPSIFIFNRAGGLSGMKNLTTLFLDYSAEKVTKVIGIAPTRRRGLGARDLGATQLQNEVGFISTSDHAALMFLFLDAATRIVMEENKARGLE